MIPSHKSKISKVESIFKLKWEKCLQKFIEFERDYKFLIENDKKSVCYNY